MFPGHFYTSVKEITSISLHRELVTRVIENWATVKIGVDLYVVARKEVPHDIIHREKPVTSPVYSLTHIFKRERKGCSGGSYRCKEKKLRKVDLHFLYWFLLKICKWLGVVACLYILYILSIFFKIFTCIDHFGNSFFLSPSFTIQKSLSLKKKCSSVKKTNSFFVV